MKCKICKREYKRSVCEYCVRKKIWKEIQENKVLNLLTPKISQDINKHNFNSDLMKLAIKNLKENRWIYIYGATGSKKTAYAAFTLLKWLELKYIENEFPTFQFINANDFERELKNTIKDKDMTDTDVIKKYATTEVLVFDDIGVDKSNEWVYSALYNLINYRYSYLKYRTILTSNLEIDQLSSKWKDTRITSRIIENSFFWGFGSTDYRK